MAASTCCAGLGRSGRCRSARGDVSRHIFLRHLCASAVPEHESCVTQSCVHARVPRRVLLASTVALLSTSTLPNEALAFDATPSGYSRHNDVLDGYTFVYPDGWLPVTTSGNDTFYRNPRVADENVFVDISSPSSSKFTSVDNLGSPDDARQKLEKQFLKEYMSTRLGVRRETQPLYAEARTGDDGRLYYDIAVRIQSYASRQQLAVTEAERQGAMVQEFDRVLMTTLGTANRRLYEFRLQTPYRNFNRSREIHQTMVESFRCKELA